jgi:hypothetical protein
MQLKCVHTETCMVRRVDEFELLLTMHMQERKQQLYSALQHHLVWLLIDGQIVGIEPLQPKKEYRLRLASCSTTPRVVYAERTFRLLYARIKGLSAFCKEDLLQSNSNTTAGYSNSSVAQLICMVGQDLSALTMAICK